MSEEAAEIDIVPEEPRDGQDIVITLPAPEACDVCGCVTGVDPPLVESDTAFRFTQGGEKTSTLCFECYRNGIVGAAHAAFEGKRIK